MKLNNNVFTLRNQEADSEQKIDEQIIRNDQSLSEWGWEKASKLNGTMVGLKVCLQQIFQDYKKKMRQSEAEQEKAKTPLKVKVKEREGDILIYEAKLKKLKEELIPGLRSKISEHQSKIIDFKENPEEIIGEKTTKLGLYIGTTILIFITIYLFVFYSSASYSAFFKEFEASQITVANSIFDAQALAKAFNDGVFTGVLILTLPFLFLGLGYIIDEFRSRKDKLKAFKIGLIIFVTFIFDVILAYRIDQAIYDGRRLNSFNPEQFPEFTLSYALTSVEFWLIIFAGFVAYLIWGLVFSFVMEAYEKTDQIHTAVKAEREKIRNLQGEVTDKESEVGKLEYLIGENKREIEKLNESINHSDFIDYKELENRVMQFFDGWLEWMNANKKRETHLHEAHQIVEIFVTNNIKISK